MGFNAQNLESVPQTAITSISSGKLVAVESFFLNLRCRFSKFVIKSNKTENQPHQTLTVHSQLTSFSGVHHLVPASVLMNRIICWNKI